MAIRDPFSGMNSNLVGSASHSVAITPMDVDMPVMVTQLYCSTSGNLAVMLRDDPQGTVTTFAVTAGQWLKLYVRRVYATGTTASVIGFY